MWCIPTFCQFTVSCQYTKKIIEQQRILIRVSVFYVIYAKVSASEPYTSCHATTITAKPFSGQSAGSFDFPKIKLL